jgi:hypothetical protein
MVPILPVSAVRGLGASYTVAVRVINCPNIGEHPRRLEKHGEKESKKHQERAGGGALHVGKGAAG